MNDPPVYVAGVGLSPPRSHGTSASSPRTNHHVYELAVSAGTKALLDAGITYDDVDQGIACLNDGESTVVRKVFYTFGVTGIPLCEVDCNSGLYMASHFIKVGKASCVLVIGFDKVSSMTL